MPTLEEKKEEAINLFVYLSDKKLTRKTIVGNIKIPPLPHIYRNSAACISGIPIPDQQDDWMDYVFKGLWYGINDHWHFECKRQFISMCKNKLDLHKLKDAPFYEHADCKSIKIGDIITRPHDHDLDPFKVLGYTRESAWVKDQDGPFKLCEPFLKVVT